MTRRRKPQTENKTARRNAARRKANWQAFFRVGGPFDTMKKKMDAARRKARWQVCLHESGHLVGMSLLLKDNKASAVVMRTGDGAHHGLATHGGEVDPMSFAHVLSVAAGPAAESLAEKHSPPAEAPIHLAEGGTVAAPGIEAQIKAAKDATTAVRDSVTIAQWCILGLPDTPDRWVERHARVFFEAGFFVRDHAGPILRIARRLFVTGFVGPIDLAEVFGEAKND